MLIIARPISLYFSILKFVIDFSNNKSDVLSKVSHNNIESYNIHEIKYKDYNIQETIISNFFFLSLFVHTSAKFGSPMSVEVNHRMVDPTKFNIENEHNVTIATSVEKENERFFQNYRLCCFPYTLAETSSTH